MNPSAIVVLLVLLLGGGFGYWYLSATAEVQETAANAVVTAGPEATSPPAEAVDAANVLVTFFTVNEPCTATKKIHALSQQVVSEGFADELESGALVFRVINTDLPENEHFLDDYEIGGKALVISRQAEGKEAEWVHCDETWLLFGEPEEFRTYVEKPIREYLAKK